MSATPPADHDDLLAAVRGSLKAVRDSLVEIRMERPVEALMARGGARRARRALAVRAAVACGIAAVVAAAAVLTVTTRADEDRARLVAYVTRRVERALAGEKLVFYGRTRGNLWGSTVTWAYGPRNRFVQFWPTADHRDRVVNGRRLWDFPPRLRGQPATAQGTALAGGRLVGAYVTYDDRRYSLYETPMPMPASACSTKVELAMGGPPIPSLHWPAFIKATLACGTAAVTGHVLIDGVETTKITGKPVTVRLSPGYGRTVSEKWARVRWALYVNPKTYLPVRMYSSTQTSGGKGGNRVSWSVTDVQWLPPTAANVARALVTIPAGFTRFSGPPGDQ
jgi:hypothetical protein